MPDYIQILENIDNSISSKIYESKKFTNKLKNSSNNLFNTKMFYKFNNFQNSEASRRHNKSVKECKKIKKDSR